MRRFPLVSVPLTVLVAVVLVLSTYAQGGPPPPDATPGSVGFEGTILAEIDPVVAPGYRLVLAEAVFAPGAYVTSHIHPTAILVCVDSGALGFALQHGQATVTRPAGEGTPPVMEPLQANTETVLNPGDCLGFDHFDMHTAHTGWNASEGETVLIEARLIKIDEPYTTFVNAEGTPAAQ